MTKTIGELHQLLRWRLLDGPHDFPGPDGGTCINEAAAVVAGFPYRKINSVDDCPPCFSRVISAYALKLNDWMPDNLRHKLLLPFVTRLAGTADTQEVERQRADLIVIQTVSRILPRAAYAGAATAEKAAAYAGVAVAAAAVNAPAAAGQIWTAATEILDAALKIGRQAEPIETSLIVERAEAAKQSRALETVS